MYYKIWDTQRKKIVPRAFEETPHGLALHIRDQEFADKITDEVQEVCRYFYEVNPPDYLGCPEIEGVSDEEMEERISRMDLGENRREAVRVSKKQYPLRDLPYQRKRALIEHIERLKSEYKFQRIDEEEYLELMKSEPKFTQSNYWDDPVPAEELIAYYWEGPRPAEN